MFPNHESTDLTEEPGREARERIIKEATEQIFTGGYHGFRMDRLAEELGMSKKTIYVHFPGKEAILDTIARRLQDRLAKRIERVLEDDSLEFPERLAGVIEGVFKTLRRIRPGVFEEFKRYAPAVFERIDAVRMELIPRVFGQLIREGMVGGYVRQDIDPQFASLAWMQLARGMTDPMILERTGLSPSQTMKQAFELFWPGVLTDTGRRALAESKSKEESS